MRRAPNLDSNHHDVVKALEGDGCVVASTAALGRGFPDLLVWSPWTRSLHLVEVKDGAKAPSDRKLTDDEERFHKKWPMTKVVLSPEHAVRAMRRRR